MGKEMTLNVRVSGALGDFVSANVDDDGAFENVSEYVRHLIRQDMEKAEQERFEKLKAELAIAFSAPASSYRTVTADDIIARHRARTRQ
ncbi:ribbon-helix-helix domain-containing protein [Novosphingobium sp.]|uniref:ribbon-helix-helix domain-containing protein n=1 Tax=Novosphingobium sp. TaxID=1874826 RepID=UPI003BABD0AE